MGMCEIKGAVATPNGWSAEFDVKRRAGVGFSAREEVEGKLPIG